MSMAAFLTAAAAMIGAEQRDAIGRN